MRPDKLLSNSADSQLAEAAKLFDAVTRAAQDFEQHEGRSNELLHGALARLYTFGEMLRAQPTEPDRSLVEDFVRSRNLPWNKVTRKNPYNALAQLAFSSSSASSRSQYATVLAYASDVGVGPSEFKDWVHAGKGIKGLHPQAMEHFGSPKRQRNARERRDRIKSAIARLMERESSSAVALPSGVIASDGFALALARIEGGQASIVDVLKTTDAAIENILLGYDATGATARAVWADEPLGRLYRAIDLILGCTADKSAGRKRHVLIVNAMDRERAVCRIDAISEAYTYAWAGVTLSGHLEGLPLNTPCVLTGDDAAFFRAEFENSEAWRISTDPYLCIRTAKVGSAIKLRPFDGQSGYRIGLVSASRPKPVSVSHTQLQSTLQFLRERRAEHDRLNARRKEKQPFSSTIAIQSTSGRLELALPKVLGASAQFGSSSRDRDLSERSFEFGDLERVLVTLIPHGTELEGTFIDTDVPDAGLCLQAWFDDDLLTVVVPTRAGTAINQSCANLAL